MSSLETSLGDSEVPFSNLSALCTEIYRHRNCITSVSIKTHEVFFHNTTLKVIVQLRVPQHHGGPDANYTFYTLVDSQNAVRVFSTLRSLGLDVQDNKVTCSDDAIRFLKENDIANQLGGSVEAINEQIQRLDSLREAYNRAIKMIDE